MLMSACTLFFTTLFFSNCTKEKYPTEEFLYIEDLSKPELTPLENIIFKKAGHRAWNYMVEAGELSLKGTSADKLHMDNRLFTVWSEMIDMAASNPDGITLPLYTKIGELWGPLDPLYDIAAGTISGYMGLEDGELPKNYLICGIPVVLQGIDYPVMSGTKYKEVLVNTAKLRPEPIPDYKPIMRLNESIFLEKSKGLIINDHQPLFACPGKDSNLHTITGTST